MVARLLYPWIAGFIYLFDGAGLRRNIHIGIYRGSFHIVRYFQNSIGLSGQEIQQTVRIIQSLRGQFEILRVFKPPAVSHMHTSEDSVTAFDIGIGKDWRRKAHY